MAAGVFHSGRPARLQQERLGGPRPDIAEVMPWVLMPWVEVEEQRWPTIWGMLGSQEPGAHQSYTDIRPGTMLGSPAPPLTVRGPPCPGSTGSSAAMRTLSVSSRQCRPVGLPTVTETSHVCAVQHRSPQRLWSTGHVAG